MTQETPEPVQKCANCGAELRPGDRFCGECGLPTFVEPAPKAASEAKPALIAPSTTPRGTWAVVTGIVLILLGLGSCAFGSFILIITPMLDVYRETETALQVSSGICCMLPALLLVIAGAVVWYVWGRKKQESD